MDSANILRLSNLFHLGQGGGGVGFVDTLNHQFTGGIMIVLISLVSARQYLGKPIQCWVPQEFTHAWEDYVEHICWVQNTYFLPKNQHVPQTDIETLAQTHVTYYQWVTIFFGLQAVLSYLPHLLWQIGASRLALLLRSAREASLPDRETRRRAVSLLTAALEEQAVLASRLARSDSNEADGLGSMLQRMLCLGGGSGNTSRCSAVFLLSRLLSISNSLGQICLMQHYLDYDSPLFGLHILRGLASGHDWQESGYFPRVTYCRVQIRRWGPRPVNSYTIQCVLSLNYFLEKVYVFLWLWFSALACLTILSSLQWAANLCLPFRRSQFVGGYLRALRQLSSCNDERDCDKFVRTVLGSDGVLLLRAVSATASDLIVLDVAAKLWTRYRHARSSAGANNCSTSPTGAAGGTAQGQDDQLAKFLDNLHKSTGAAVV